MSKLAKQNGDDYPEAATKHLRDATVLLNQQRADGAAYLSGYVVECALKSLLMLQGGTAPGGTMPWTRANGHKLGALAGALAMCTVTAGPGIARYLGPSVLTLNAQSIVKWAPDIRYHAEGCYAREAREWVALARAVYEETITRMKLDGVI